MPKFEIDVCRTGYGFARIEVEAETKEVAENLALDEAGDHDYNEKSSEYTLVNGGSTVCKRTLVYLSDCKELRTKEIRIRCIICAGLGYEDNDGGRIASSDDLESWMEMREDETETEDYKLVATLNAWLIENDATYVLI
jgi:hypothetical protein